MTATFRPITPPPSAARRSLQQRIRRRLLPIFGLLFVLLALPSFALPQIRDREQLSIQRREVLNTLARDINDLLARSVSDVSALATSSFVRAYNDEVLLSTDPVAPQARLRLAQRDMLRALADLVTRNPSRYIAIRYLTRQNAVWGEVSNAGGQITLNSSFRARSVDEQDEAFFSLLANRVTSGVRLSASNFANGYIRVYVPVPPRSGEEPGGILAMDVNLLSFNAPLSEVTDQTSNLFAQDRAAVLVNNRGQLIASSNIDQNFDDVRAFLSQNPGSFENLSLGALQISTVEISPYTGSDLPWRVALIDNPFVLLSGTNNLSVLLLVVVTLVGALLLVILDRVLFNALRPLENVVSSAAERLKTNEFPRIDPNKPIPDQPLGGLTLDAEMAEDMQVVSLMNAIDVATQRIASLAATLDEQTRRRARDIEVASRIGRATAQLIDIDELVNRALQFIITELRVYHAQVFLLDDVRQNAILSYSYGEAGRRMLEAGHRLRVGSDTVVGRASGQGRPVTVNDTRAPQSKHGFNALLPNTRSELALPLLIGDRVIGVLDIQSTEVGYFTDEDLPVYELLADQLAVAINKAQLLRQTEQRLQQIESLNRQMTSVAWEQFQDPLADDFAYSYDLSSVKPITQSRAQAQTPAQNALSMPISVRGEVIGEIAAEIPPQEPLTENQRNLLRAVADRVALAVENARLFAESRNALAETNTLYTLSRMLNEARTLDDILRAILSAAVNTSHRALMWLFPSAVKVREDMLPDEAILRSDCLNTALIAPDESPVSLLGIEYDFSAFPFLRHLDYASVSIIEDTQTDARLDPSTRALMQNLKMGAAVFIPLYVRDDWVGITVLGFADASSFGPREMRLFPSLLDPLSIAVNSRLLAERNEQNNIRNENLYGASRAINGATNYADLVAAALNTTTSMDIAFSLALLEGETDETGWPTYQRVMAYSENYAVQSLNFRHRIRIAAASPLRQRVVEVLSSPTASPDISMRVPWLPTADQVRFIAIYPLFSAEGPIALFYITSSVPMQLSSEDDEVYRSITAQMSTQLQNRRLLERTAEALDETRRLYIATRAITSAQSLQDIYFATADHLARPVLAAAGENAVDLRVMLWMARPEPTPTASLLEMAYEWSVNGSTSRILDEGRRLFWTTDEMPLRGALNRESWVILNVTDAVDADTPQGVVAAALHANGAASALIVPVESHGNWFGYLVVHVDRAELLTERYASYVEATAGQLALALENKMLLEQTEASVRENLALYRASRALSNATTPAEVLEVLISDVLAGQVDHVFLVELQTSRWDVQGASARVVAEWRADNTTVYNGAVLDAEDFSGWPLLSSPDVIMMGDYDADMARYMLELRGSSVEVLRKLNTTALVVFPLRVQDRILGAIWASSSEPQSFDERTLRIFQSFSEQASLTLDASRLLEQTNRRARQLQTSAEVSNTASQILELDQLLPRLVDLIKTRFGYDHAQIFLLDEREEYAELRASTGDAGVKLLSMRHKLRKGSASVIGQVIEQSRPIIAADTADAEVIHAPNPYLPDTRSELALPLIIQGKAIGALDVQSNNPNAFTPDDVAALTTLAAQISVAIDNANLYREAQDQANRMGLLFDITTSAAAAAKVSDALQRVADGLYRELVPRDVVIYVKQMYADALGNTFEALDVAALAGFGIAVDDVPRLRLAEKGGGALGEVARTRQLRVIGDVAADGTYRPIVPNTASAIIVPLVSGTELLGIIAMEGTTPNEFGPETVQLVQTLSGSLSAIIQNAQFVDRLSRANEELRELDRLKSDFLANMSHELRTPLNSIIGFSRMMLKGMSGPLSEMQEQDLNTIFNSGNHLLTVINDILDQAKITAGKMTVSIEEFDVKPELEAVKSIGLGLVKDKPIDLRMDVSPNLPKVYGDKVRVRQVMLNLVSNASKFTKQGAVTIRAYPVSEGGKQWVRVDVTDTGIGIAEKDMPLLFEPFRQVDSSLTRTAGGTGLGLPIARSLMQLMGGALTVTSQVGVGSTFTVTIPTEPVEMQEDGDMPPSPQTTAEMVAIPVDSRPMTPPMTPPPLMEQKRQILVVEDNPDMVDQYRRTLQRQGFEVIVASSMLEARAVAPALQPTLIVMDVDFDGGSGWELLEELHQREDTADIPIIIATLSEESVRAQALGAFAFLQRPYAPDQLIEAVERAEKMANVPRILLIDDQDDALKLLGELLREHGNFRIYTARSGMEGLMMVAVYRPNLVILDLRMPEMDGFAVLQELRQNPETSHIPVMIVTNEDALKEDERQRLMQVHVIQKATISLNEYERFIKGVSDNLRTN
jgi:GAF domain-containing protein/DNA-binding response OmpR family regulator